MSSEEHAGGYGLGSGREWSTAPQDDEPIVWTIDPALGLVQGPLELQFLRGRKVSLILEPGQLALLTEDQEVRAVYLDGRHLLDVGTGRRQVSPACRLVFLSAAGELDFRWTAAAPLAWGEGEEQALIGTCSLRIDGPAAFHATFIAGVENCEADFRLRLIEQVLRGVFEDMLRGVDGRALSCSDVQMRLGRLAPADLDDDLEPYGLACVQLAVYTAQPPVEDDGEGGRRATAVLHTAGHFDGVGHN